MQTYSMSQQPQPFTPFRLLDFQFRVQELKPSVTVRARAFLSEIHGGLSNLVLNEVILQAFGEGLDEVIDTGVMNVSMYRNKHHLLLF